MKLTEYGSDFIVMDESNLDNEEFDNMEKIHLIKIAFQEPTEDKVYRLLDRFKSTNRFVVEDNIKFYNDLLKNTNRKYYVENTSQSKLISFFRKNNKVLLNTTRLAPLEVDFVYYNLKDILKNIEVIMTDETFYNNENSELFANWKGNLILV